MLRDVHLNLALFDLGAKNATVKGMRDSLVTLCKENGADDILKTFVYFYLAKKYNQINDFLHTFSEVVQQMLILDQLIGTQTKVNFKIFQYIFEFQLFFAA